MARIPFKMRSGNSPLFKQMGSSPVKKKVTYKAAAKDPVTGEEVAYFSSNPVAQEERWEVRAANPNREYVAGESSLQSDQPAPSKPADETATPPPKKGKGSGTVSYAQAYKTAGGKEKLGDYTGWLKKAKDWNKAKYGTTEPTAQAKKSGMSKEGLAIHHAEKMKQEKLNKEYVPDKKVVTKKVETKEVKPKSTSRKERKQEKTARKSSGRLSRREIKYEKLASKAESALAEGKGKKAERLAKRASKKLRKKGVRTSDKGVGKTSDRMVDLGLG